MYVAKYEVRRTAPAERISMRTSPDAKLRGLEGARVLVVDDNADSAELIELVLMQAKAQVELAFGGPQGLELVRSRSYDLLLIDLAMPDMNGYELLRAIRSDQCAMSSVPCIAVTALGRHEAQAISAGFDDHVLKPFHPDRLLLAARQVLQTRARR
jgi:CheY-like chemotaxis protein